MDPIVPAINLTEKHKKQLRTLGHPLKCVVTISSDGLKDTVIAATNEALEYHELIKLKIRGADRAQCKATLEELANMTNASIVSHVGFTGLLFRRNAKKAKIILSRKK